MAGLKRPYIFIDFETRSTCDLLACGTDVYANHPDTEILCMAYAIDDAAPALWIRGEPPPIEILIEVMNGATIIAHNASFEINVWNKCATKKYGWPPLDVDNVYCTMAMAYNMGLPGSLENAALASGIQMKKDTKGHRIMLQLSQPRSYDEETGEPIWWDANDLKTTSKDQLTPKEKYDWLYRYCLQDVVVERELFSRFPPLSAQERKLWGIDQRINERGIYVDMKAVNTALDIIELQKEKLTEELKIITQNQVATPQAVAQMHAWLKDKGVKVKSIAKADVLELLERGDLPKDCRRVLEIRREAAKSSTAKLDKFKMGVSADSRVRGCFQYYGAAATGRWAGRRIQLHNLPRPSLSQNQIDEIFTILHDNNDHKNCVTNKKM